MTKTMALYVHIPFCSKKCDYCDFVSYPLGIDCMKSYLTALLKEIDMQKQTYSNQTFGTIFIGGGTPSVLFNGFIKELSKKIFSSFKFCKNVEFTIEANPKSLTEEKLKEYISSGINRISLGVQSLDDDVLQTVGRNQTKQDVINAFNLVEKYNFKNVNADVIIGLPNSSKKTVLKTIEYLIPRTTHISAYGLQIEQTTPLYKNIQSGKLTPMPEDEIASTFSTVANKLKRAGFMQYEISNFARPKFECKHNQKYWDNSNYLGLGVAAHSFVDGKRFCNTSNLNEYIKKINLNTLPIENEETLTTQQQIEEFIMLSLRTSKGLNLDEFNKKFNQNLLQTKTETIKNLKKLKLIEIKDNHLKIKPSKFYLSNAIIVELI